MTIPQELVDSIADDIAAGATIKEALLDHGVNERTFARIRIRQPDIDQTVMRAYAQQQMAEIDAAGEMLRTEPDVQRAKVRWDYVKWKAGKYNPRLFGDRIDVNVTQTVDINQAMTEAKARVLRPMRDPDNTIEGEFVALPSDQARSAIDKESTAPDKPDIFG